MEVRYAKAKRLIFLTLCCMIGSMPTLQIEPLYAARLREDPLVHTHAMQQASPGYATPEQLTPEQASLEQAAPQQTPAGQLDPEPATQEQATPEQAAPEPPDSEKIHLVQAAYQAKEVLRDAAPKSERSVLDVATIYQRPELPNGCEIVSGATLLQALGCPVDKLELADNYLEKTQCWYGADPRTAYMGNPRLCTGPSCGFYVWQEPVISACNRYLADHAPKLAAQYRMQDLTDCAPEMLFASVERGNPVAVWFEEPSYDGGWTLPDGQYLNLQYNSHCLVLRGYDKQQGIVYLADPMGRNDTVGMETFLAIWQKMGCRAVAIQPQYSAALVNGSRPKASLM